MAATLEPAQAFNAARRVASLIAGGLGDVPPVAVITGSGWDTLFAPDGRGRVVTFDEVGLPSCTVEGHAGNFFKSDTPAGGVLVQEGRLHVYEGFSPLEVALSILAMKELGVQVLLLLNAAGGLNDSFEPGDLMLIRDHVCLFPQNPLRGLPDGGSTRFVRMDDAYSERLRSGLSRAMDGDAVREGVYAGMIGPSFETPAELALMKTAGADAVGMSTVPEVLMARYAGIELAAVSLISNVTGRGSESDLTHALVLDVGRERASGLSSLVHEFASLAYVIL